MERMLERYRAIDTDTHITEPPDVWTARVASKWGDKIPHIETRDGRDWWVVDGEPIGGPGFYTMAGWTDYTPNHPLGYSDIPKASYDAKARLEHMDAEGIHAQVLYPNVGGFGSGRFTSMGEPQLVLELVQAYNDFLVDWCSADPSRLIPVMATPFWDVDASCAEIRRCADKGIRAVLHCSEPEYWKQPKLGHPHWDPLWATAQECGMSISFHVGAGGLEELQTDPSEMGHRANFGRVSALSFMANSNCLAEILFGGVCHRFPELKFVSVESGAGWIQSCLELFDWQWLNSGVHVEHPEYELTPSEYFRRQVFGCFWFESDGLQKALELWPDNLLWETDYPHPTCQHPGPATVAERPNDYVERALAGVAEDSVRKVLHDNAAALYGVD